MALFFLDDSINARGAVVKICRLGFDKVISQSSGFQYRVSDGVVGCDGYSLAQELVSWDVSEWS